MNGEKNIRQLIGRFMQGLTSIEEEEQISQWLAVHTDVSDDLKPYQQMFAYFDKGMPIDEQMPIDKGMSIDQQLSEDKQIPVEEEIRKPLRNHSRLRPLWCFLAAAAAVALLVVMTWPAQNSNSTVTPSATLAQAEKDSAEAIVPIAETEMKNNVKQAVRPKMRPCKRGVYRKHLHSPAPPVTWIAQTVIDSMQQSPEALAEAHLQALEEQQNEMLFRLYLVSALQTEDLASYNDEDDYGQEQENAK